MGSKSGARLAIQSACNNPQPSRAASKLLIKVSIKRGNRTSDAAAAGLATETREAGIIKSRSSSDQGLLVFNFALTEASVCREERERRRRLLNRIYYTAHAQSAFQRTTKDDASALSLD
jgi:hypothetical protein